MNKQNLRSCGYQWRPSIPIKEIGRLCAHIQRKYRSGSHQDRKDESKNTPDDGESISKDQNRELIIFVDNCYGELVEEEEPCHVGADLVAGSLIKNIGGTLAPCGGYIAGRRYVGAIYRICSFLCIDECLNFLFCSEGQGHEDFSICFLCFSVCSSHTEIWWMQQLCICLHLESKAVQHSINIDYYFRYNYQKTCAESVL